MPRRARRRAARAPRRGAAGFQSAIVRSARGAPSSATTAASSPASRRASSPGFAIVAEAKQELRVGPVHAREAAQAPQHVRDVGAEDATVDVRLVDDDVGEVREHVTPAVVVGQHADVEHVRVGEDEVRPLADLPAALLLGVAVVDRGADARDAELGERPRLVLGERLRRVEVEGAQLRVGRERAQDGEVEGERLPRRGAGRDDDVAAALGRLPGVRLVRVEPLDAARGERVADARVDARRGSARRRGRAAAGSRGRRAPRPRAPRPTGQPRPPRGQSADEGSARLHGPGCPAKGLRSHPSNLIRIMPAKGAP